MQAPPSEPPVPVEVRYNVHAGQRNGPLATITVGERSEAEARRIANAQWDAGAGRVRITVDHTFILGEKVRK